jgi:serine/threonine protein kinase
MRMSESKEDWKELMQVGIDPSLGNPLLDEAAPEIPGYEIEGELGAGGMGVVYLARNPRLGRQVAVKMMHPGPDDLENERLLREGKALGKLNHPHIVGVHDVVEDREGRPCLVMEYVDGGDLAGRLTAERPPEADVLSWFADIVDAVGYAHSQGILHRDLKPANILFDRGGTVKVGDFGLAALARGEASLTLTLSGTTAGTEAYMSPEQKAGDPLDVRSDIYSLGVMFYEMLTGRRPQGVFASLANRRLDRIVRSCMREQAADRYPDCAALLADLKRSGKGKPFRIALGGMGLAAALAAGVFLLGPFSPRDPAPPPVFPPVPSSEPDSPPSPVMPPVEEVDLLALLRENPGTGRLQGSWRFEGDALLTMRGDLSRAWMEIPFDPGEAYDLEFVVTRLRGNDSMPIFFPSSAGAASLELDAWELGVGGFQNVDGMDLRSSGLSFPFRYRNGVPDTVLLRVRPEVVSVRVNGELRKSLALADRRFTKPPIWELPEDLHFAIGAWEADARFDRIVWRRADPR